MRIAAKSLLKHFITCRQDDHKIMKLIEGAKVVNSVSSKVYLEYLNFIKTVKFMWILVPLMPLKVPNS